LQLAGEQVWSFPTRPARSRLPRLDARPAALPPADHRRPV